MAKTTPAQEKAAKKTLTEMRVVLEIVPARQQTPPPRTSVGPSNSHGVRYHVTCKRNFNSAMAFVFDYWGTLREAEDHAAPTVFAVLVGLIGPQPTETAEKVQKFFTPEELTALAVLKSSTAP